MAEEEHVRKGQGLGIGEITIDEAGEGDGCDRCGCPDEELCCPCFWSDNGVPPIWPLSWVFNPKNPYLNNNQYARMFGNMGFVWFDHERKAVMGVALTGTVVSLVVTWFCCLSFSTDRTLLGLTSWGVSYSRFQAAATTQGGVVVSEGGGGGGGGVEMVGQITYIGLRQLVLATCTDAPNDDWVNWGGCTFQKEWWSENEYCSSKSSGGGGDAFGGSQVHPNGMPCADLNKCGASSVNNQLGAYMTAFTLLFALLGCLSRLRKIADTNFQKVIGCLPDTFGCLAQGQALSLYAAGCQEALPARGAGGRAFTTVVGPAYWAFMGCWVAALLRAAVHILTPVPGGGAGCHLIEDMTGLDLNRDGFIGKPLSQHGVIAADAAAEDQDEGNAESEPATTTQPTSGGEQGQKQQKKTVLALIRDGLGHIGKAGVIAADAAAQDQEEGNAESELATTTQPTSGGEQGQKQQKKTVLALIRDGLGHIGKAGVIAADAAAQDQDEGNAESEPATTTQPTSGGEQGQKQQKKTVLDLIRDSLGHIGKSGVVAADSTAQDQDEGNTESELVFTTQSTSGCEQHQQQQKKTELDSNRDGHIGNFLSQHGVMAADAAAQDQDEDNAELGQATTTQPTTRCEQEQHQQKHRQPQLRERETYRHQSSLDLGIEVSRIAPKGRKA